MIAESKVAKHWGGSSCHERFTLLDVSKKFDASEVDRVIALEWIDLPDSFKAAYAEMLGQFLEWVASKNNTPGGADEGQPVKGDTAKDGGRVCTMNCGPGIGDTRTREEQILKRFVECVVKHGWAK